MFDDFAKELRRRQAAQQAAGRKQVADQGEEAGSASSTEGPREDDQVSSQESDPGDTDRDDDGPHPIFERGGWGGGPRRARFRGPSSDMPEFHVGRGWIVVGVVVVVLLVLLSLFALTVGLATDAIWFASVGFGNVFWTRLGTQVLCFVGGFGVAFLFLWVNVWLAGRFIPKGELRRFSLDDLLDRFNVDRYLGGGTLGGGPFGNPPARTARRSDDSVQVPDISRPVFWGLLVIGLLVALTLGGLVTSGWTTIQLFLHRVPFGQVDPTFGKDIGFYIFELPLYRLAQSYANALLLVSIALVGIRYLVAVVSGASMPTPARVHLGLLVMLYLWSIALGFQLDRYELVYSGTSGIFQGAGYTDTVARVLSITVMTVLAAFAGAFVLGFAYTRMRVPLILTLVIWVGAYGVLNVGYPVAVQRLQVEPNQQGLETPYIKNNIDMTRQAFGLSNWSSVSYTPGLAVTQASLSGEQATIQNLRLWDYRPLQPNLTNSQLIRPYYSFADVDTDRYTFTDAATCAPNPAPCVRQVMLSGRELDPAKILEQNNGNSSWVNQHLIFTHGIGLVMLPVNEVVISQQNQSASPKLVVQDLPPVSAAGAPVIAEPRIYFGTQASDYVIVGGDTKEFDYQSSGTTGVEAKNTWTGTTGIKLDTPLAKLLFAAQLGDLNLLISNQVSGNSQLLYRRSIQERVQEIAPFLRYDKDPYLVVTSTGRLDYVLDAFTTSAAYPDANLYDPSTDSGSNRLDGDPFNYIRNSVKVVMDAYDGTTTFYVADPTDPIIQAWEGVFPGVFHPLSDMSPDLQAHLRYPESMYNAQTSVFGTYHVTDPSIFYSATDVWNVVRNSGSTNKGIDQLPLEAYYVEMQIPGQSKPGLPEFLLLQPMVPSNQQKTADRPNMIAWVAAHNDPGSYGKVEVFNFPGSSTILGPKQIQAYIAANQQASKDLSLWSTQGSTVTMGNLLVVPLQDSILYVEPVYVQSANNPIPVLQKVALAGGNGQIVWADPVLETALQQLASGGGTPSASPSPGTSPGTSPTPNPSPTATAAGSPTPLPSVSLSGTAQQLADEAIVHYKLAQQAYDNHDLGTYQSEMEKVGQLVNQLGKVLGTPAPSAP
jgi:uncharacterized membrane protein (UPF0182 family)